MGTDHGLALCERGDGENNVGAALDRRRDPTISRKDEVELLHRIVPTLRLRSARTSKEVRRGDEAAVDFIWHARFHGLERKVCMRVQDHAHIGGIFLKADDLVLQLGAEFLPAETEVAEGIVNVSEKLAARDVHVAGNCLERQDAVSRLRAVGLLVDSEAPKDCCVAGVRVHARRAVDVLDVKAANLRSFFGGHCGDAFRQLLEAVTETIDEVVVVQIFLDDDVEHRHAERCVGTRAKGKVVRRARCEPVGPRVN